MTYQELLLHPLWRERRGTILRRDEQKCLHCANENILQQATIGALFQTGQYHSGWMYRFRPLNELFGQKALLKTESTVNEKAYIAYADKVEMGDKFAKVIAVRKRRSTYKPNPDESFLNKLLELEMEFPVQSLSWVYVQGLHVHHTYYQLGTFPWEYPDAALQTLCWVCHEKLHRQTIVPLLDEAGKEIGKLTPCSRCYGAGYFPEYKHVQEGICFGCNGARYIELIGTSFKQS
jgi:hypothetical protein